MKLELKHLAPYLPYGLRIKDTYSGKIHTIRSISQLEDYDSVKIAIGHNDSEHIWMFKPILRPLSDLTKTKFKDWYGNPSTLEEWINGDVDLGSLSWVLKDEAKEQRQERIFDLPYFIFPLLFEHHFDVFNLIPNNLAIDINTIKS